MAKGDTAAKTPNVRIKTFEISIEASTSAAQVKKQLARAIASISAKDLAHARAGIITIAL